MSLLRVISHAISEKSMGNTTSARLLYQNLISKYDLNRRNYCTLNGNLQFCISGTKSWNNTNFTNLQSSKVCQYSINSKSNSSDEFNITAADSFQGVQGDVSNYLATPKGFADCPIFKQWLRNCRRYGLSNCKDQLQSIQSGEKTVSQVLAEQEKLLEDISQKYKDVKLEQASSSSIQGFQDDITTFTNNPCPQGIQGDLEDISQKNRNVNLSQASSASVHLIQQGIQDNLMVFPNPPCPQGIQGDNCDQFNIWLENCFKFGYHDCLEQYNSFMLGKKTLNQIFLEQEGHIKATSILLAKLRRQQIRTYSTSTSSSQPPATPAPSNPNHSSKPSKDKLSEKTEESREGENVSLSQKDKLKRAVKDYGSTVIVFHVSISLMSLGFFYALVSSGVDVIGLLRSAGIGESVFQNKLIADAGTFVMAYAVHKVFAPVRIATTLTATPLIVRYLRKIGVLKGKSK